MGGNKKVYSFEGVDGGLLEAREAFALERLANYLRVDVDAVDVSRDGAARLVVDNRG